jgi:hypothetical protein
MKHNAEEKHPNIKRYIAPISNEPEITGIDFERAYETLMEGFIDAFVRRQTQSTNTQGSHTAVRRRSTPQMNQHPARKVRSK